MSDMPLQDSDTARRARTIRILIDRTKYTLISRGEATVSVAKVLSLTKDGDHPIDLIADIAKKAGARTWRENEAGTEYVLWK